MSAVALVSFRLAANGRAGNRASYERREVVAAAVAEAHAKGATHVVLPGWTFTYSPREFEAHEEKAEIQFLAALSKTHEVSILAEVTWDRGSKAEGFRPPPEGLGFLAFERGKQVDWQAQQLFATSGSVASRNEIYGAVADDVFAERRTIELDGVRFLVLVCGENNLFANVQSDPRSKNRVILRHALPEQGQTLRAFRAADHDVVLNPAHTEMGNLGKHFRRWKWLSEPSAEQDARYCFFTTNVWPGTPGGRAMYGFRSGRQVVSSPWKRGSKDPFVVTVQELLWNSP